MAKIHVLSADFNGRYNVIVHVDTPPGSNDASKTWKSVLLALNLTGTKAKTRPHDTIPRDTVYNASSLITGANGHSWQITAGELAELAAGDKIELSVSVAMDGSMNLSDLNTLVDKEVIDLVDKAKIKHKYYGLVHIP